MATNHTENYNLNLWEPGDTFLRTEFNENSQKIDAALKAEADARSAGDAALTQAVNGKAEVSAVTALTQTVNTLTQTVSGVTQNDLISDLNLTGETAEIIIPLPAGYLSKYRQLVMYAEPKSNAEKAYLYFTDSPETKGVMVTGGNFVASSHGVLAASWGTSSTARCFNRVIFDLSTPRACTVVYEVKSYLYNSDPTDVRVKGAITFYVSHSLTWPQVTRLRLTCEKPFLAGTYVKLYGVR